MAEQASDWYLALVYSLASIFMSGFLLLPVVILLFVFDKLIPGSVQGILLIGSLFAVWWGTRFTAGLVQRKYLIPNQENVVNISLVYFLFTAILVFFSLLLLSGFFPIDIVVFLFVVVLLFYWGSKRHLKETKHF